MPLLYVVAFDANGRDGEDPFTGVLDHTADWLSRGVPETLTPRDLSRDGTALLPPIRVGDTTVADRTAVWEWMKAGSAQALRTSVNQPLQSGVMLTTRVTLSRIDDQTRFRASISREYSGDALAPVQDTTVFQPGIVEVLARDDSLQLQSGSQVVDSLYQTIRTEGEAVALAEVLRSSTRLPVLLIHGRTAETWELAPVLARKLVGLVRIVTLNYSARSALSRELPRASVPFAGARLLWSDIDASILDFPAAHIIELGPERIRALLMARLAPVSALVRAVDDGWHNVRRAAQQQARSDAAERVRSAHRAKNNEAELEELRKQVAQLETDLQEAETIASSYAEDADGLRVRLRSAEESLAEAAITRDEYLRLTQESAEVETDPWDAVPILKPGKDPKNTFLALVDASDERVVFTDNAAKSWKKIKYPQPEEMTAALITLARAACSLYGDSKGSIDGHIDEWFKNQHGLNVATSDYTIKKTPALRYFDYDGKRRDQMPHVKVRDAVRPNAVGRIYFALDSEEGRFIVNHVALKLHGL